MREVRSGGEVAGSRSSWLTADEAAAYLGLRSRKALYQAVRRGQIPARRLGTRRLRFAVAELDALMGGARHGAKGGQQ